MRLHALKLLAALSVMTLTACATIPTTGTQAPNFWCLSDEPISFSGLHDTPETIKAIRRHNAAWRAVCEK